MNVYDYLIESVENGKRFRIDFNSNTMTIGKEKLIDKGKLKNGFEYPEWLTVTNDGMYLIRETEHLYEEYKCSVPSKVSHDGYFKAKSIDELSDEDMVYGERREIAQAKLEGMVLCVKLNGQFHWNAELMGKWFYQSKTDKDFVLLKSWFEN